MAAEPLNINGQSLSEAVAGRSLVVTTYGGADFPEPAPCRKDNHHVKRTPCDAGMVNGTAEASRFVLHRQHLQATAEM